MHELVIKGGNVVDGTGSAGREVDVGIDCGIITAVGSGLVGTREVDARGLLVTPGFVDVHTHYDAQVSWDPYLTPSTWHGCTTVIMGNCGVGFAPAHPDKHAWLIQLMEGVEDIPGAALTEGITWGWETFPEYLDVISKQQHAIDVGALVPHGAVRAYVMGDRAGDDATPADIAAMRKIVKEALDAGAFGFSTSRTPIHKAKNGDVAPGTFATHDELFGIAGALDDSGRGVYQVVIDHPSGHAEFSWMEELARTGRTVTFNLQQSDLLPGLWSEILDRLNKLDAGVPLYPQVAGRAIGLLMHWEATAHPFGMHPTHLRMMLSGMPVAQRLAELKKPEVRAQILSEAPMWNDFIAKITTKEFAELITGSFNKMFLVEGAIDYEPPPEANLIAMSKATGKTPQELAYDHLNEGKFIYFPLFNYTDGILEPTRLLQANPRTRMGLSDAGAHCGAICDGGMPTFMLTHWARDRQRGARLPLEHVINKMTAQTAGLYGLKDRGVIAPGMLADINVIDFAKLAPLPPKMVYDLPAGGRRLLQRATGYVGTWKSGVQIVDHDEPTGALPGKILRCERSA